MRLNSHLLTGIAVAAGALIAVAAGSACDKKAPAQPAAAASAESAPADADSVPADGNSAAEKAPAAEKTPAAEKAPGGGTPEGTENSAADENSEADPAPESSADILPDAAPELQAELDRQIAELQKPDAKIENFRAYIDKITGKSPEYDNAVRFLYACETRFGQTPEINALYSRMIAEHPVLNAKPRRLVYGKDIAGMKRLGGGSTLVYRLFKDGETVAAYKPLQSRFQSNYRSEIAAYRFCPLMKCGFDVPENVPVYFDFDEFSRMYARNPKNLKSEFKEILPTKLPDKKYRIDGTYKRWIPDFADFPIEITSIWRPWLNPGVSREDLMAPLADILPAVEKKHARGADFVKNLKPHVQNTTKYAMARQISNMIVFDFLINNWDRFSGVPSLYGVNCQIVHGRFMSIDNGASFAQTPNPKPLKQLERISRFSRMTYDAVCAMDKDAVRDYLFPEATVHEREKIDTFWNQREKYIAHVQKCIAQNGEAETFFFE